MQVNVCDEMITYCHRVLKIRHGGVVSPAKVMPPSDDEVFDYIFNYGFLNDKKIENYGLFRGKDEKEKRVIAPAPNKKR